MNAINFIKQHGVEKAREVVSGAPWLDQFSPTANAYYSVRTGQKWCEESNGWIYMGDELPDDLLDLSDLKRLVESVERINSCGGLHGFKTYCNGDYSQEDLQVIADYEAIGGEHV